MLLQEALELCAEEKEVDVVDMVDQILAVGQPRYFLPTYRSNYRSSYRRSPLPTYLPIYSMNQTTHADFIRLHDDREMYKGVYAKGGR